MFEPSRNQLKMYYEKKEIMLCKISFLGQCTHSIQGIILCWRTQVVTLRKAIYSQDEFLHKWQERNEKQDMIIVDRISVLGFLTDKERSNKVAEWAYAQGKENNYLMWNG